MEYSMKIQEARKLAKLSQTELAQRLGKTQPTISQWENGETAPDIRDFIEICNQLGLTPNELLGIGGEAEQPIVVNPKVNGAHITCSDGDVITISAQEEILLVKSLAKARSNAGDAGTFGDAKLKKSFVSS